MPDRIEQCEHLNYCIFVISHKFCHFDNIPLILLLYYSCDKLEKYVSSEKFILQLAEILCSTPKS